MKRLCNILEGVEIGFLSSGCLVIMGNAVSSTSIGITITLILSTVLGGIVNRISGAVAGLIAGGVAVLFGNMMSESTFGMVTTLSLGMFIGGLIAWELSHPKKSERDNSGQFAR